MTGWIVGWSVGLAAITVVVLLLTIMIVRASRVAATAEAIAAALDDSRDNTLGLWEVETTRSTVSRIVRAATAAREHLASQGSTR